MGYPDEGETVRRGGQHCVVLPRSALHQHARLASRCPQGARLGRSHAPSHKLSANEVMLPTCITAVLFSFFLTSGTALPSSLWHSACSAADDPTVIGACHAKEPGSIVLISHFSLSHFAQSSEFRAPMAAKCLQKRSVTRPMGCFFRLIEQF